MRPRALAILALFGGFAAVALTASAQQGAPRPSAGGVDRSRPLFIDWPAAARAGNSPANLRGLALNDRAIRALGGGIRSLRVPLLLPGDPDLAATSRIYPNSAFYTVSAKASGLSFVLTGSGRAFLLPPATLRGMRGGLKARIPADGIEIEQTETGIDASFNRFGASYSVALECARLQDDPRCANPAYVRGVISRLVVVPPGGAP